MLPDRAGVIKKELPSRSIVWYYEVRRRTVAQRESTILTG